MRFIIPQFRLRNRIVYSFLLAILPAILLMVIMVELFIAPLEKRHIHNELAQTTELLANSIQASTSIAICEHLRCIAERDRDYARLLFADVAAGLRTREDAIALIYKRIREQRIGDTGYAFCLNSKKMLVVHPKQGMEGRPAPDDQIANMQLATGEGYFEYKWRNPLEKEARDKALYQVYFKPLDLYISVTSYRSEFARLLNPEDFRKALSLLRFGKTGYAYIFSASGEVVIHPHLKKFNIFNQNKIDSNFARQMLKGTNGLIDYYWPDSESGLLKEKIGSFIKLPDLNWVVASAAYTDEVYAPVNELRLILYGGSAVIIILATTVALLLSRRVIRPLEQMVRQLEKNGQDNTHSPLCITSQDEIGKLAENFNKYLGLLHEREDALRREQQLLTDVTDNSPGAFYQFFVDENNEPKLSYLSMRFKELVGVDVANDELVKNIVSFLNPSDQRAFWESLGKAIAAKTEWQFEGRIKRPDDSTVWLNTAASPTTRDGVLIYNGFLTDVTERKRLEEQIHHIQKMDAIGKLAGGVAHDFNNLIGGIMGSAEVLQIKEQDNKNVRQSTDLILKTATQAAKLTEKLLSFSRKEKLESTHFKITEVVKETITLLEHTLDKKIRISLETLTEQTTVLGDFSQMQNALLNLGINSSHAMPEGGDLKLLSGR